MEHTLQNALEVNRCMTFQIRPEVLDKIREERELASDEALARFLGLSLGTVHWLRKGRTPTVPTLVRVMDAANVKYIKSAIVNAGEQGTPAA